MSLVYSSITYLSRNRDNESPFVCLSSLCNRLSQPHVQNKMDCHCYDSSTAKYLHFRQHISQTCRCCFYNIPDLRHFRRHIYFALTKTIATALVSSRLDYSFYHNIALHDILKFRCVQNCLAKLPDLLVYLTQCNFLNNRIGSLSDITLFLRSVQLPIKHFHPSNQHICIPCSLLVTKLNDCWIVTVFNL